MINVDPKKLKAIETSELDFLIGVGREGVKIWKGRKVAEVKRALAILEAERKRRKT